MRNIHNGRHAAETKGGTWGKRKLLGVPLVVLVPVVLAGAAVAAWVVATTTSFTGDGTTVDAQQGVEVTATSVQSVGDSGPDNTLTCDFTLNPDGVSGTLNVTNADISYDGTDDALDDYCLFRATLNYGAGYDGRGVKLTTDGVVTDAANNTTQPFKLGVTNSGGGCNMSGSGQILDFGIRLSELNSDPGTTYSLEVNFDATDSGEPCWSTGIGVL